MSDASATRKPVEMRFCVSVRALLVAVSDCSAVIAATLVLMLAIVKSFSDPFLSRSPSRADIVENNGLCLPKS